MRSTHSLRRRWWSWWPLFLSHACACSECSHRPFDTTTAGSVTASIEPVRLVNIQPGSDCSLFTSQVHVSCVTNRLSSRPVCRDLDLGVHGGNLAPCPPPSLPHRINRA